MTNEFGYIYNLFCFGVGFNLKDFHRVRSGIFTLLHKLKTQNKTHLGR